MASSDPTAALERLQESVIDGRTDNGRYRQDQLQSLHKTLREEAGPICDALQSDASQLSKTEAEVEAEYYLTMQAVKHFYDTIDFEGDLQQEYSVAHGKDNANRRVGVGMVVVRPTSHTRFYSAVVPLAAAIAAGNCLVLELSDTLLQVDALLRTLLTQALDPSTFCIVKSIPEDLLDRPEAVIVDQVASEEATSTKPPRVNELRSSSTSQCIAIVDRSADIEAAAKAITTARFSFGGTSPYAPDLVLVNEFVKKEFFEACSRHASSVFAGGAASKKKRQSGNREEELKKAIKAAEDDGQVTSFGSSEFKLVDVLDKTTSLMTTKISGRYLPIATCSSLTDAVYNHEFNNTPLLAGYFFAEPESAKFLAQFVPCHISVINKIPAHLLVGPAAPTTTTHEPNFLYRYNRNMFSVPRPQFVEKVVAEGFQKVEDVLLSSTSKKTRGSGITTTKLRDLATKPLPPTGQPDNKGIGFFESGLLVGAGIYASLLLPALGFTTYFLGRKGLELAARYRK